MLYFRQRPMIALQTRLGLDFGEVMGVDDQAIVFQSDSRGVGRGEELAWRLELVGWNQTVSGRMSVVEAK